MIEHSIKYPEQWNEIIDESTMPAFLQLIDNHDTLMERWFWEQTWGSIFTYDVEVKILSDKVVNITTI